MNPTFQWQAWVAAVVLALSPARKRLVGAAFLLLAAVPARAQRSSTFETLSIEHGLPQSQVSALAADASGYLWIGTPGGGLARFDGAAFETYTIEDGLAGQEIRALTHDPDGRLWIGTEGGFSIREGRRFLTPPQPSKAVVRAILSTGGSDVWVGSDDGLRRYDRHALDRAGSARAELQGIPVYALAEDGRGGLWIGTRNQGLARYSDGQLSFVGPAGRSVRALMKARDGRLWVATDGGVLILDEDRLTPAPLGKGFEVLDTHALVEDAVGDIWLGTGSRGLCRYRTRGVDCFAEQEGLGSHTVWSLAHDTEGNLWAGTYRGGLSRYLGTEGQDPRLRRELGEVVVRSILEDRRGRLWFATDSKGVLMQDGDRFQWFRTNDGLRSNFVLTLLEDRRGAIWFGTLNGLSRFAGSAVTSFGQAEGLPGVVVRALAEDAAGSLWVGTDEGGAARWDGRRFLPFGVSRGLNSASVFALFVDSAQRLWAGTSSGLNLYDPGAGRFTDASSTLELPRRSVYAISEDPANGDLWLAIYGEGLARITRRAADAGHSRRGGGTRMFNAGGVLSSDQVVSLGFGPARDLWVGTESSVDRFSLDSDLVAGRPDVLHLGAARGPSRVECIHGALEVTRSGRIWFGTLRGAVAYDLRAARTAQTVPRVWLNDAGPVPGDARWTSRIDTPIGGPESVLYLAPRDNQIAFSFKAVSLSSPDRLRYQYRLEGHDHEWSSVTAQSNAYYGNLPAGEYSFRVRAAIDGRSWVETPAAFRFRVLAPFWGRAWFQAFMVGVLALLAYGSHRIRLRRLGLRNADLESFNEQLRASVRERQKLIAELETKNGELERFTYTVSHDLKAPLVTIRGFASLVEKDAAEGRLDQVRTDLPRIRKAAETMSKLLEQLLDLSRIGRVVGPPETLPLGPLILEAARLVPGIAAAQLVVAPELPAIAGDRTRLLEVFENLLGNAVKFMGGQAAPRVEVSLREGPEPVIVVSDNGIGIDPRFKEKVFDLFERLDKRIDGTGIGLAIVKRIVESHGGRIWVESSGLPGEGSRFCLTLPIAPVK